MFVLFNLQTHVVRIPIFYIILICLEFEIYDMP